MAEPSRARPSEGDEKTGLAILPWAASVLWSGVGGDLPAPRAADRHGLKFAYPQFRTWGEDRPSQCSEIRTGVGLAEELFPEFGFTA